MNQVLTVAVSVLALSTVAATIATKNINRPTAGAPPVEFVERKQVEQYLSRSLYSAVMTVDRYLRTLYWENRFEYPGDGIDLTETIFPHYGFLPARRFTFQWRVMTGQHDGRNAVFICAYPTTPVRNTTQDAIAWMYHSLPNEVTQLGVECGTHTMSTAEEGSKLSYWLFWPNEVEAPEPPETEVPEPAPEPTPEPTPEPVEPTPDPDPVEPPPADGNRPPGQQDKPLPPGLEDKPLPPGWTKPLPPGWNKGKGNTIPPGQAKKQP